MGLIVFLNALLQQSPAAQQGCANDVVVRLGGTLGSGETRNPAISGNGRYVAFESSAPELDGDFFSDVFVYDRVTCALELVSVNSSNIKGDNHSTEPSISYDGQSVAFMSRATNLVSFDPNGFHQDAFVRDRESGVTRMVSLGNSGVPVNVESATRVRISANGEHVVFVSEAATLVSGDTNDEADIFVRNLMTGVTLRVSIATDGTQGESPFSVGVADPVIDCCGRFVAFASEMNTLVPDDFNDRTDIFVHNLLFHSTIRASLTSIGAEVPFGNSEMPALTLDGRYVFFSSDENLVPGNTSCDGLFIRDLMMSSTSCLALDPLDVSNAQNARRPAVSNDGRYVTFSSYENYYVPGDTNFDADIFVHDQVTGRTRRASVSRFGSQPDLSTETSPGISGDGQIVVFDSLATNLVVGDNNDSEDVFVTRWVELPSPPEIALTLNGSFTAGLQGWQVFSTPDPTYIVTNTTGGELQFYRLAAPPGTSNQAVVFQNTGATVLAHMPVEARFRLGNSSSVRKRISVLIHDADFSDLAVCNFWLAPNAPMRNYVMRGHTTRFWSNATISFYAATPGSNGGFYHVDDVLLFIEPINDDDVTDCVDPTAPLPAGGDPSPTLLTNGNFSTGLAPWATFGQISWQITDSVFEFVRPPGTPAGVVLQATGQPLALHDIVTATLYLGNSSGVRKRATLLLHDLNFSDLSACTFWLPPNMPLSPYVMRTFATEPWANATFSLYPGTVGPDEWIRFTGAILQITPAATAPGTECWEPGAVSVRSLRRRP